MANVNIATHASNTASALASVKSGFLSELDSLQSVVRSIGWTGLKADIYAGAIGEVTFGSYNSAQGLVGALSFTPVDTKELLDGTGERNKTHIFESDSLDSIQGKLASLISNAGTKELKSINTALVSQAAQNFLFLGYKNNDAEELNDHKDLLSKYLSADNTANEEWLDRRYTYKTKDRLRNAYIGLFDLAQQNFNWAVGQQIAIENLHADFTSQYDRLLDSITAANIAVYKAEVEANIKSFEAEVIKINNQLEVDSLALDRDSAEWGLKIQQANQRLNIYSQDYSNKIQTNLNLLRARIAGGANVADGYKSIFGSYASQFTGLSIEGN